MIETNDNDAPYNLKSPEPIRFDKRVNVYLSKEMKLYSTHYEDHVDCDGFGYCEATEDSDFKEDFEQHHRNITELLDILAEQAKLRIGEIDFAIKRKEPGEDSSSAVAELNKWKNILEDCKGWKLEDMYIDDI